MGGTIEPTWSLVAIKRRWIPDWLFTLFVYGYRFFDSDVAEHPWARTFLTTKAFHYHDLGPAIYGFQEHCRMCRKLRVKK